jgi:ribosomal protein S18 acetylase RimI-like enzyme
VQIRQFSLQDDYEAVLALWRAAAPGVRMGRSDTRQEIARKLERDPELFLVAVDGHQVIGAVLGGFDGRRGLVYHLAVAEAWRRQGIGTALMDELDERLRTRGCRRYYLLVTSDNTGAVEFYRRRGLDFMPHFILGKDLD